MVFSMGKVWVFICGVLVASTYFVSYVSADRYTSTNYVIDASRIGNSFGGDSSDASYEITSSGGESIIGEGSGGSYTLDSGYVAQLENSLELSVQPSDLEFYYTFNEISGSFVRDSSANDNNGTTVSSSSWGSGQVDNALSLNGSSQYVTGTDVDVSGTITVGAWVYPTSTQTSTIVSKNSTASDSQTNLTLASSVPTIQMTIGGSGTTATDTGNALPNNTWSYVAATYDGSDLDLYVDGDLADTTPATGAIATNNLVWTIGRFADSGSSYFAGAIDEVKMYSRALSANEIKAEYNAGVAGNTAGLSFASEIIPGVSQTSNFDAIVLTDAYNYTLSINQNQNLTKGGDSISAISGTIASPASWSEGTTKGLGFTLYGTNATAIDAKWSSGSNYAAFPGSATSIYTRTGQQSAKDVLNMRLRLDVADSQPTGLYTNVITTTGTITP